ncbi:MAG: hypothetical protein ACOCUA_01425 [archaeon]
MHHQSEAINERLAELEEAYLETDDVTDDSESDTEIDSKTGSKTGSNPLEPSLGNDRPRRGPPDAPF